MQKYEISVTPQNFLLSAGMLVTSLTAAAAAPPLILGSSRIVCNSANADGGGSGSPSKLEGVAAACG